MRNQQTKIVSATAPEPKIGKPPSKTDAQNYLVWAKQILANSDQAASHLRRKILANIAAFWELELLSETEARPILEEKSG